MELRKSALLKSNLNEESKKVAQEPLTPGWMSSEYSDEEDDGHGSKRQVVVIHQLPWRSGKANRLMKRLDSRAKSRMSNQSLKQMLPRVIGSPSKRPKPTDFQDDFWGFTAP